MIARSGRYQQRSSANAAHFTASFCVIRMAAGAGKCDVRGGEGVMVGKRMAGRGDPQRRDHVEEALRIADAGNGVDFAGPAIARDSRRRPGRRRLRHGSGSCVITVSRPSSRCRLRASRSDQAHDRVDARAGATTGSRSGPAGSMRPLPNSRDASTTAISIARASA